MAEFHCSGLKFNIENKRHYKNAGRALKKIREIKICGDKSITHRALILAAMAKGVSTIKNPSKAEDCLTTIDILKKLGTVIKKTKNCITIESQGIKKWQSQNEILDCRNSGTTARLMFGALAGINEHTFIITGDRSLTKRPMRRVSEPLTKMGADIMLSDNGSLPGAAGGRNLKGIEFLNQNNSAQVKTAVLLAGLNAGGLTKIIEPNKTRDHFEKMAKKFGIKLSAEFNAKREYIVMLKGPQSVKPVNISIAGDISTAAFYITLDILIKKVYDINLNLKLKNILLNDTRLGFFKVLERAGIKFNYSNIQEISGEKSADIMFAGFQGGGKIIKALKITDTDEIVSMIDEIPLLALVLCFADGESSICGLGELRLKESDRLKTICDNLSALKAKISIKNNDSLKICGTKKLKGAVTDSNGDHRIAMMLCIAGFLCNEKFRLKNIECAGISNPDFFNDLKKAGLEFKITSR